LSILPSPKPAKTIDIKVDINICSLMAKTDLSYEAAHTVQDSCVCFNLQRAARSMARRYDEVLRPSGLSSGQFSLMMLLMRPRPPTISALASELSMDRTTLTALLKPLQRRRLVETAVGKDDRRQRHLTLTTEGRRALRIGFPLWQSIQKKTEEIAGASAVSKVLAALQPYA